MLLVWTKFIYALYQNPHPSLQKNYTASNESIDSFPVLDLNLIHVVNS